MPDEAAAVKPRLEFAKEVETYAEYALYTAALRASDRAEMMELYDILEHQAPTSEYLPKLNSLYIGALGSTGKQSKAFAFAEKAIARDPSNEDLLAVLADGAMTRKQWERAAGYGTRLASVMSSHPKPEGVPVGDWEQPPSGADRTRLLDCRHVLCDPDQACADRQESSRRSALHPG